MEVHRYPSIIIDNGHGFMKAGFSGEKQLPTVTIPCRDDVLLGDFVVEKVQEERLPTVNLDSLKEVSRSNILQNKNSAVCVLNILSQLYFIYAREYSSTSKLLYVASKISCK